MRNGKTSNHRTVVSDAAARATNRSLPTLEKQAMHGLKRTMRSKPQYRTPKLGSFSEEYEDAISYAQRVSQEYAKMEDGHHAAVRQFLQRAYIAVLMFRHEPDAFERLKTDPFWQASRQKPRDASTSKWVLYFIMEATTTNVRNRAGNTRSSLTD
jgi:hypothetical protein